MTKAKGVAVDTAEDMAQTESIETVEVADMAESAAQEVAGIDDYMSPPKPQLLTPELLEQFIGTFYIPTIAIPHLRFTDHTGTLYQLDVQGGGRFILREVRA